MECLKVAYVDVFDGPVVLNRIVLADSPCCDSPWASKFMVFSIMPLQLGVSENGGFPQQPWGFPTTNDHFGVWNGGTTI